MEGLAFGECEGGFFAPGFEVPAGQVVLGVVGVFPDVDCGGGLDDVGPAEEDLDFSGRGEGFDGAVGC